MRRVWQAALLGALVLGTGGCSPTTVPTGASPQLASALKFAAYPGGKLVNEAAYQYQGGGPFYSASSQGYAEYETKDDFAAVQTFYQGLGKANGWSVIPNDAPAGPSLPDVAQVATMSYQGFTIYIALESTPHGDQRGACGPVPCSYDGGVTPPPGPTTSPSPTATPGQAATGAASPVPSPSPSASSHYVRVEVLAP